MRTYKTKQQNYVLECLKNHKNESLSVEDIIKYLKNDDITVGTATVYRHIGKLLENEKIRKIMMDENGSVTYRYLGEKTQCDKHFHMICSSCNTLFHMECKELEDICKHISKEHNFEVDIGKTVLYGICENCKK